MRGVEGSSIDPSGGRFFCEVDALSKALNMESRSIHRGGRAQLPSGGRSLSSGRKLIPSNPDQKEKKHSSLWSWKSLKALSHIRHRRFECVFSLRVHAIENLPPALANTNLCVHWKRTKADSVSVNTRPAAVFRGSAKFEETLSYSCSVYGSRSRAQGSAKYEARNYLIYATVFGAPGLDLGKHRVDLTRLLPLNIEELEGKSSGKWSTVFRLSGKAIGASLSVSFGFSVAPGDDKLQKPTDTKINPMIFGENRDIMNVVRDAESLPAMKSQFGDDENYHGEVSEPVVKIMETKLAELSGSTASNVEAPVLDEQNISNETKCNTLSLKPNGKKNEVSELLMFENGAVISNEETINDSENVTMKAGSETKHDNNFYSAEESVELAILLGDPNLFDISDNELEERGCQEIDVDDVEYSHKEGSLKNQSRSLDDLTEEVATEFLSMLDVDYSSSGSSSDGCPESPREQLWKQFKLESSASSNCFFDLDSEAYEKKNLDNSFGVFDFSSYPYDADSDMIESKSKAQMLEDAETEALLREWGLDEKIFDGSPPGNMNGFGSPIHLPLEEPPELPPLGENLGPFVQMKDGGFLRSMSPNLFKSSKSKGNLIMQVSKPVVMPAEMGSDNMEILEHLASIGVEKLSMQASKLMPLEEITGGLMQQLSWESASDVEAFLRQDNDDDSLIDLDSFGRRRKQISLISDRRGELYDEYVSLEELAPLAMDKIEALSIEGLKMQSGMSDGDAPSNITKQYVGEVPVFKGKETGNLTSLGLEGTVGLQLLDVEDNGDDIDGLMGLSISLDEWMQLDMGIVEEEHELSDRTSKILAAHHAKSTKFSRRGKNSVGKRGLLESSFTVALMVQLRDPLRNYEHVGTPMLALIQVERVFLPPKPKIYSTVSDNSNNESDTELEPVLKLEEEEEGSVVDPIPQFKVTEVHVAGLKIDHGKKMHWGSSIQHQSGSRWLLANGMGKHNKHPYMKSNTSHTGSQLCTKVQPEETLWSITSRVHSSSTKLKEVPESKPRVKSSSFWPFR